MTGFTFQTTPNIRVAPGSSADIGSLFAGRGARHVLLVTDAGVRRFGLSAAAEQSLAAAGVAVSVFDAVVADPPAEVVLAAVEAGRAAGADAVLGLGGGSPMDTAKLVAYLLGSGDRLEDIYGVDQARGRRLPLVLVPTTAGTGSEVTPIAIVTTGEAEKKGVVSASLYADWAVLDAELTLGLPPAVTAATGVDAMVHAIEAYTSRHKKNPLSDALAREALRLLGANLVTACTRGDDVQARSDMLLGALLAGQAFANAPVAAVHALAYPLGGHFHIPHGLSNALMLPHVLAFNLEAAGPLYGELAPLLGGTGADGFRSRLDALVAATGLPRRLRDVAVPESALDLLADDAMKQTRLLVNNPREVSRADARALYAQAW